MKGGEKLLNLGKKYLETIFFSLDIQPDARSFSMSVATRLEARHVCPSGVMALKLVRTSAVTDIRSFRNQHGVFWFSPNQVEG